MKLISRLLRKNTSPARVVGFVLSNFIGLAIIIGGLQFFADSRSLWADDDNFIGTDYLVVNKKVTSANTWQDATSDFSAVEIADVKSQPWVRDVGEFQSTLYRVWASLKQGGKSMSTMMFFESIPDKFVDAAGPDWHFTPGDDVVPVIVSKDYLTLYNFGFAGSAGLPQMSESIMSGIPLSLTLTSYDGREVKEMNGRVVGFSNRLNTILVPQSFMEWSNSILGDGREQDPSRLIIDVSSPGDVAIKDYLSAHNLEVAGDKSNSSASFLLKVVMGIVLAIGIVITALSFFILLLSMSLLMEKNRDKLHSLLMLGCPAKEVASPYIRIVVASTSIAFLIAVACGLILRHSYLSALEGLGARTSGWFVGPVVGFVITLLVMTFNVIAVRRKVRRSFRS
uniref:ABC transporter permease n=1 Tax=uncultured Muribaculaceae bacterium TaxID=2301481 RepID=A0A6G8F3P5_9BACT|nr:hypothetical protein Muribac1_0530 [uncultured Muribaculaceae bacterium]